MLSFVDEIAKRTRLTSWKRIAVYLDCGERTARRWRDEEGLPVHSIGATPQSSVFAYTDELDAWLAKRASVAAGPAERVARQDGPTAGRRGVMVAVAVAAAVIGLGLSSIIFSGPGWGRGSRDLAPTTRLGRVAVRTFESLPAGATDLETRRFFTEEIRSGLSAHGIEIAAAQPSRGAQVAELVVGGSFRREGNTAVISFNVVDQEDGALLWASDTRDEGGDFGAARVQALAHLVGTLHCVLGFRASDPSLSDRTVRELARFCEAMRRQELRANIMFLADQVLRAAPDSAFVNGLVGGTFGISANWTDRLTGEQREAGRRRAKALLDKAVRLDPHGHFGRLGVAFALTPTESWRRIESVFLKHLARENPRYIASLLYARFLSKVGRLEDAVHAYKTTLAREPLAVLSHHTRIELGVLLAQRGEIDKFRALFKRVFAEAPDWRQAYEEYVVADAFYGGAVAARAAFEEGSTYASRMATGLRRCLQAYVGEGEPTATLDACATAPATLKVRVASSLGLLDAAFASAGALPDTTEVFAWAYGPETAAMRRDPRFTALAEGAGLARYWKESPPDFMRSE